jgi:uncharacterized membrane protein
MSKVVTISRPPQTSWAALRWGFLAGLVLGVPMVGTMINDGGAGTAFSAISAGISDDFVTQVKALKKPGTSAVFVVEAEGDMEVILLKTNVDVERARLNQSALAASPSGLGA